MPPKSNGAVLLERIEAFGRGGVASHTHQAKGFTGHLAGVLEAGIQYEEYEGHEGE